VASASPSLQDWRELYAAAIEFRQLEPWRWMYDEAIFGVKDPVSGQIGYCTILGNLGECFALAVYRGTAGLEFLESIQDGEVGVGDEEVLFGQDCLMASFEGRQSQAKEDLQVIKALGLKFKGSNGWPQFRSYRPGYFPWFLTQEEAKFLTVALQQAKDVAVRSAKNPELTEPVDDETYFVRMPVAGDHGIGWMDAWLVPATEEKGPEPAQPLNEVRLEAIRQAGYPQQGEWELDFFMFPSAVRDKEQRPYFPYALLCMDRGSTLMLTAHLAAPAQYASDFQEQLYQLIEQQKAIPQIVYVCRREAKELLKQIAERLQIKLKTTRDLPLVEDGRAGLFGHLGKR
jgi:hypothetical protein